jgi:restriction system protein
MPEVTRRRTGELLRKLFEILMALPEGMQGHDALEELQRQVQLTNVSSG